MSGPVRGKALIINNRMYDEGGERRGSDIDLKNTYIVCRKLGLEPTRKENLTAEVPPMNSLLLYPLPLFFHI